MSRMMTLAPRPAATFAAVAPTTPPPSTATVAGPGAEAPLLPPPRQLPAADGDQCLAVLVALDLVGDADLHGVLVLKTDEGDYPSPSLPGPGVGPLLRKRTCTSGPWMWC